MAIVGGAIFPLLQGVIADHVGVHHAFVLPVACYLYIVYFGFSGSKPNSERGLITINALGLAKAGRNQTCPAHVR